jgi:hypothetical protein
MDLSPALRDRDLRKRPSASFFPPMSTGFSMTNEDLLDLHKLI